MKTISVGSTSIGLTGIAGGGILLVLLAGAIFAFAFWKNSRGSRVLTEPFSESLNGEAAVKVDINTGSANLLVDRLTGSEKGLVSGALQYLENQELPARTLERSNGQATFTLKASGKRKAGFQFSFQIGSEAPEWQIRLNPSVPSDIIVDSAGGNVRLNLAGLAVTHVSANSGGGSMVVSLPDNAANQRVTARAGGGNVTVEIGYGITGNNFVDVQSTAGNVVIRLPDGIVARIIATSGMGKVKVDTRFVKINEKTYQSPDYEHTADKIEIRLHSGAGNVTVSNK